MKFFLISVDKLNNDGELVPDDDNNTKTPEFMDCDTGDTNVDVAITRWYEEKKTQIVYANDRRYSAMSVAGFQYRLTYMSEEQGVNVNNLTTDELNKLFEYELNDQASETLALPGAANKIKLSETMSLRPNLVISTVFYV